LEKVLLSDISGYDAVNETIADMRNSNRAQPYAEDAALADGLAKMLQEVNLPNIQVVLQVGQQCDYRECPVCYYAITRS
jgi:hypothetical protein